MKAYGKPRQDSANRKRPGTSKPCPCCIPRIGHIHGQTKTYKKAARAKAKKEINDS